VICDEAAWIPFDVFYGTIVPLIGVVGTALAMISSPGDGDNFYTKLMERRDPVTGQRVFNVLIVESACSACRARGEASTCDHRRPMDLPPWKRAEGQRIVREMYGEFEDIFQREMLGLTITSAALVLDRGAVDRLHERPRYTPPGQWAPRWWLLCVDPALGGSNHTAIVGAYVSRGQLKICCLDSHRVNLEHIARDEASLLRANVLAVRRAMPHLAHSTMVFAVERTGNAEVSHMKDIVTSNELGPYHIYYEANSTGGDALPGVQRTAAALLLQTAALKRWIHRDAVDYDANAVCGNPWLEERGMDAGRRWATKRTQLEEELKRLRYIPTESENPHHTERVTVSGKVNDRGRRSKRLNDDMASSMMMLSRLAEQIVDGLATYKPPHEA